MSVLPWVGLSLVEAPASEPITPEMARLQCSLGDSAEFDAKLAPICAAARERVEDATGRKIILQTWDVFYACLNNPIILPFGKLAEVTQMAYTPSTGAAVNFTIAGGDILSGSTVLAHVEADEAPYATGRIVLAYGQQWPTSTLKTSRPVRVRIKVGWTEGNVPARLIQAMQLLVGDWFRNSEDTKDGQSYRIPNGFEFLVRDYIVHA